MGRWGGDVDVLFTCTHGGCHATHAVGWGGDVNVPRECTHDRCYASHGLGVDLRIIYGQLH